ncbi:MAG TPA: HEPN domain-containing protein [Candidatus Marinimicrobia bacterium]|nr:HEPN domain-containing protein [Candidatus Neomarinimicrobiota bacterium]
MKKNNPWLEFATEDYETIQSLQNTNLYRSICFHAQQTVEKILKAYLFSIDSHILRIHDISQLFLETGLDLPNEMTQKDLEFLSSIYIETRYPPDIGLLSTGNPDKIDANRAIKNAEILFNFILNNL